MVAKEVIDLLPWPHISWCEDQRLFERVRADERFGAGHDAISTNGKGGTSSRGCGAIVDDDTLAYIHRRHESNVSASHRESMWQGIMPLQLAGAPDALVVAASVKALLAQKRADGPYLIDCEDNTK